MFTCLRPSRKARRSSSFFLPHFSRRRAVALCRSMLLVVAATLVCLPMAFKWSFGVARGLTDAPSQLNGFVQKALLTASDGASNDQLGKAVALSGDTALVGAPGDNVGANADQGSAYVFRRTGAVWT
jgi:hypothetical protein